MADAHKNFAYSTVASGTVIGSSSGTSLTVATGDGAKFPAAPFNVTVWPAGAQPLTSNAEIMRVTTIASDTLTVTRNAEAGGSALGGIAAGYQVAATITARTLQDVETPHAFLVDDYGALGDGKLLTDVGVTNGSGVITSAGSGFVNAAVGQWVMVNTSQGTLIGQITSVASAPAQVTIGTTAAVTESGDNAVWGTDDTTAINAAVTAAETYAEANAYYAEIRFRAKIYVVAGLTQSSTTTRTINAQIPIPMPSNNNVQKLVLAFKGAGRVDHFSYWNATVPAMAGTCIVSMRTAPLTVDPTFGVQSVFGAPTPGSAIGGVISPKFINHKPVFEDIAVWLSVFTNVYGFDMTNSSGCYVDGCSVFAFAQPLEGNGMLYNGYWSGAFFDANTRGAGISLPTIGNNADVYVPSFTAEGVTFGVICSAEHVTLGNLKLLYNDVAIACTGGGHGLTIEHVTAEAYQGGLLMKGGTPNPGPIYVASWSTEDSATAYDIRDDGTGFRGEFHFFDTTDANRAPIVSMGGSVGGTPKMRIINDALPPGIWASPPSVPASTVAQQNTAWRDAAVSIKGGTVSAIAVDGTTVATATNTTVVVPSGHTITLTYSAAPTWVWTLN